MEFHSKIMIRVLPEDLVKKISAGEVIERPASVVKELVENALDAGASNISVEIKEGGRRLIRVADDGIGMNEDDLRLSVDRHTTSKIKELEDIYNISTLGFRGEALSSIAAVSKMEITSRFKNAKEAFKLKVNGNKKEVIAAQHSKGTQITINDLFYNVPARLKFMKSKDTETGHINDILFKLAVFNYKTGFDLKSDGRELLSVSCVKTLKERLYQLFGDVVAGDLVKVSREEGGITVSGFVCMPEGAKSSRNYLYTFVNGRLVSDKTVNHAISAGYGNLLPYGKFPLAVIFIDVDPKTVDVNVHPTKKEIKFSNSTLVHGVIDRAVKEGLIKVKPIPGISAGSSTTVSPYSQKMPLGVLNSEAKEGTGPGFEGTAFKERVSIIQEGLLAEKKYRLKPLYQVRNLYIIAVDDEGLYIIDQHVAHEKLLYEQLKEGSSKVSGSQQLLVPISINLSFKSASVLSKNMTEFKTYGFDLELIGKDSFMINGVPTYLGKKSPEKVLMDVVEELEDELSKSNIIKDKKDTIIKTMACHSAVRSGDALTFEQMLVLINDFIECDLPYCPHGRPGIIKMTFDEFDKKFKRA